MLSSCHAHQAKCQKDSRLHSSGSVDKTSVFNVNLANHLENRLLADFLSRKRSKALIYMDVACNGLDISPTCLASTNSYLILTT